MSVESRLTNYIYRHNFLKFLTLNNQKTFLKKHFTLLIIPRRLVTHSYWLYCILGNNLESFDYNLLISKFYNLNIFSGMLYFYKSKYVFNYKYLTYDFKNLFVYNMYFLKVILKYNFYIFNKFNTFLVNDYFKLKLLLFRFLLKKYLLCFTKNKFIFKL